MKIVIIGSGIAGLTLGAYLSREGHKIKILEQFDEIGGVTATIKQDGFEWDIGPLLLEGLGPNEPISNILNDLEIKEKIPLVNEDRGLSTPDFQFWRPDKYQGLYWRREKLKELFPDQSEGLDRYYNFYLRVIKLSTLGKKIEQSSGIGKLLLKIKLILTVLPVKKMLNWNASQVLDYFFTEQKIKGLFSGILADFVVKTDEFFGLGIPMVNIETAFDKRIPLKIKKNTIQPQYNYIIGGCGVLVNTLADLIKLNGGQIITNALVNKILINEDNKAYGVSMNSGENEMADLIIATGSAKNTFLNLISPEILPDDFKNRVENLPLMESVMMVHIGIDFDPTPYQRAALCYYYRTYDVDNAVDQTNKGIYHEGAHGFLIYVPSMHSPKMAPPNMHAVTVYTIAPNTLKSGDWTEQREEYADKLLAYAEEIIPGLREHTKTRIIMTPDDFKKRINVKHHSFGGSAPKIGYPPVTYKTPIEGLWFAGCQSESTGGVANTMNGAKKLAKLLLKKFPGKK